jgi:acyl-CoA synthetase (AMP-forming)/AMP-acid ligase II
MEGERMNAFPSTMMDEELNLWDFLERAAALFGRKEVVSRLHTGEVHRTTYAEVYQRARRLMGGLKALGVGVGDRVATLGFLVEAIRGELKTVQHFVVMDEKAPEGYLAYEEALGEEADPVRVPERAACGMAYTTGTTGLPIPLVRLRVADEEGRPVPKDGKALGEVQLKGPWITGGYYGNEEATRSALTPDGFFRTGDIAVWDEERYVEIKDRLKDLIKSGGEWISSVDLENALMGHPKVKEAAVVAIPHPKWQERPLAVVVPRGEKPTPEELNEHLLKAGFAKWQLPDAYVFAEEIPRTSAGKFLKRALREQYKNYYGGA